MTGFVSGKPEVPAQAGKKDIFLTCISAIKAIAA